MNGVAWVVETKNAEGGKWELRTVWESRNEARHMARLYRVVQEAKAARVRKYIRQPEVRP